MPRWRKEAPLYHCGAARCSRPTALVDMEPVPSPETPVPPTAEPRRALRAAAKEHLRDQDPADRPLGVRTLETKR